MPFLCLMFSHSFIFFDRRRDTAKSAQNHSESLSAGLSVPCRICFAWFGPALGLNPARNRRFPAGSLQIFEALVAQPSLEPQPTGVRTHSIRSCARSWNGFGCCASCCSASTRATRACLSRAGVYLACNYSVILDSGFLA